MRKLLPLCLAGCLSVAHAHDLWLDKEGKHWTLFQGHRHSAHAGSETMSYGSNFVTAAKCLDERGKTPRPLAVLGSSPWKATGDCAALLLEVSSGYWSKTPWETQNVAKPQAPGALKSWLSKDSLKLLCRSSPAFSQPLGEGLEIVPTTDPFLLKPGDKLVVRVLRAGKPLVGVPVAYHGDTRGETGPDGRIAIRLRHGGIQLISASIEVPLYDGKADAEMLSATLQWELPQ